MDDYLESIYYNRKHVAGFTGSPLVLYRAARKEGKKYTLKQIRGWLLKQDAYTLHRPRRVRFKRLKTIAAGLNDHYQCDLSDMKSLVKYNGKYRYILSCVDVLSRRAMNVAIKNKNGKAIVEGFKRIFKSNPYPKYLQSDRGGEFSAKEVTAYLKKHHVHPYTSGDYVVKASLVERYQKTLKTMLHRYFTRFGTYKYVDVLPEITEIYNNTPHTSTGVAPNSVNYKNQGKIWRVLHWDDFTKLSMTKKKKVTKRKKRVGNRLGDFDVGDRVRVSASPTASFLKGFRGVWSREVFVIHSKSTPLWTEATYRIKDQNDELIDGRFYAAELKKVDKTGSGSYYAIDKILKSEGTGAKRRYYVSWVGYGKKFRSWIKHSDLKKLSSP